MLIHLLHWTLATKQPAMTAPAMAQKLQDIAEPEGLARFVDEVAHLLRSQIAGIVGNLALVIPLVLGVQLACRAVFGAPLVGIKDAEYVLHSLNLWGPSLLFAAFTGVLLFTSSAWWPAGPRTGSPVLPAGKRSIAWNPHIVAAGRRASAPQRWAHLGAARTPLVWPANVSSGPDVGAGAGAAGVRGPAASRCGTSRCPPGSWPRRPAPWASASAGQQRPSGGACRRCILAIGVLNLGVSFYLAFKVALRSRGIQLADRARVRSAIWQRLRSQPRSFFLPPKVDQG